MYTTRRAYIKASGSGLAAILATSIAPSFVYGAHHAPQKKLGLAIIGLGGYATNNIAPEIASTSNVRIAGVVTGHPDTKGKAWSEQYGFDKDAIYTYDTIEKIANDDRIDLVHIALPNSMHAEFAIKAAKAGKHVMVEKPMATSSKDCQAMIEAAKKAGVLLGVNYRLHWEPHHVKATELLASGAVGDLTNGNYEFSWGYYNGLTGPNKDKIKKWLLDPVMTGGGALFDTGVYPIQAACYLTGKEPVSVRGFAATRHPEIFPEGVEETMSYELMFDDGFQALCRASYSHSFHECSTVGPNGKIEIMPGERGSVFGQSGRGNANPKLLFHNNKEIVLPQTLQQADLLEAFATAIQAGETSFKTPGEMGLRDIRIAEAVYKSACKDGRSVTL